MSKMFRNPALSAFVFLAFAALASAQTSAVEGDVNGEDGAPLKGAVIKFDRKDIKGAYKVNSDKKGHYGHYGLPLGTYKISVEVDGQVRDSIDNVRTRLGDPLTQNFDLKASKQQQQALQQAAATGTLTKEQERGMSAEQKTAFDKANKAREATMAKNKELNDAFNTGKSALEAKNYDAAADALAKASVMAPDQHVVWAQLAEAYMGQATQKPTEADALREKGLDAFKKAIELQPSDAAYYNNYALALVKAKKLTEAQEALGKAAQLDPPGAGRYFYNLGAVLENANQVDAAREAFKKAIDADPNYADAQYQYGITLLSKVTMDANGKQIPPPGTKEAFQKYLDLKPTGPFADSAKAMLAAFDTNIATKYVNPDAPKKSSKKK